ncbi:MAG TPA: peptidylprolyl isomerase [Longilinea sp.]|nr:peptidylprolyl isomerase [Longilinea sp.]
MKKSLLLIVIILSLLLTACNAASSTEEATTEPAATEETTAAATEEAAPVVVGAQPGECLVSPSIFPEPKGEEWLTFPEITATDHVLGSETPRMVILEYADYTCPYCVTFSAGIAQFVDENLTEVQYVYRNFPVGHTLSNVSIQAAEAAGLQGFYWEMHNILFNIDTWETWDALSEEDFQTWIAEQAATITGLNVEQFMTDMNSEAMVQLATQSSADAVAAGLTGTPSIYIILDGNLIWAINVDPNDGISPTYANLSAIFQLWKFRDQQYSECPPTVVDPAHEYYATLETSQGNIVIQLFPEQAPLTVNSFVFLAQEGWFDNVSFHRVIEGFVAQTGDPTGTGIGDPGYMFGDEISADLNFDTAGMVGMANSGSGTNGSQFFITLAPVPDLDGNYTVFGQVVEGMDVLTLLTRVDPTSTEAQPDPDMILHVTIEER